MRGALAPLPVFEDPVLARIAYPMARLIRSGLLAHILSAVATNDLHTLLVLHMAYVVKPRDTIPLENLPGVLYICVLVKRSWLCDSWSTMSRRNPMKGRVSERIPQD